MLNYCDNEARSADGEFGAYCDLPHAHAGDHHWVDEWLWVWEPTTGRYVTTTSN